MSRVRTAIIGCGKVGQIHAAALATLPEAELVAVNDDDAARAARFGAEYGARPFADVTRMVEEASVQAAIVCTPHPVHAAPAVEAIEAGANVLVEKPLAATLEDCDRMIAAAARRGVKLGVVSQRRFFEPVVRMKAAIDAGKIGKPMLGSVVMLSWRDEAYYRSDPWRGKWATEGGGVLINQSPHHLDLLQWLMGPVEEISGRCANFNHPYIEVEDTAVATIRFRSGGLASIMVSLCQKPGIYTKIHVHGTSGASVGAQTDGGATFIAGMSPVLEPPLNDLWTIPGEEALLEGFRQEDTERFQRIDPTVYYHTLQVADFVRAVRDGRDPMVAGQEGRVVVEMIQAIYHSGRSGQPVRLSVQTA